MKAWLLTEPGRYESLTFSDAPNPVPGKGDALLHVHYAALNPADRFLAEGQYPAGPTYPHILGRDGVGTVTAVGEGVDTFKPGDRALVLRSEIGVTRAGTFAEQVAVPVESVTTIPEGWSEQEAAAAPLVYLTAYQALKQWGDLSKSVVVLVTGASGGVGVATIQLAQAMGHTIVALSRSDAKRRKLIELGATHTFDPADDEWPKNLKTQLGDRRVDLAVDNVGGAGFTQVIESLAMHGRVSVVGRSGGPVPQFNTGTLFFRRIRIGGVAVGTFTPPESQAAWREVLSLLRQVKSRPIIDSEFPMERLRDAFERLSQGPMGKVLLRVAQ
jgi:NADPH2:quinone reductase